MSDLKELAVHLVELARSEGAKDVVAQTVDSDTHQVRFSNSQIDAVNGWSERHVILFVAVGKHAIASDLRSPDNYDELAKRLVVQAKKAPENEGYGGIASGRFKYKATRIDRAIVGLKDPSKFAHEAISAAESEGANNVGGTFFVRHQRCGIASSAGALATDESASVDLSVRAFSQPEASGHALSCTPRLSKLRPKETGAKAGRLAAMAKNPAQGDQGRSDFILEPLFIGGLINSTSNMMSAFQVDIGMSMYAKKIGKRVASEEVTIVDDPVSDSTSRRAFDHEGVPCRRNIVVKDGILKNYLHNTSTAKRFKTKTTANAGPLIPTAFTTAGQPLPFHPVVVPGDWKVEEMIADTKRGLYANNTWYTRYQNYSTGEFSTIPRDAILRIENGEIVGAVKNIRVSDNMMNLWKSADAISKSSEEIFWWDEAAPPSTLPTARFRGLNVTRSS
ncbi:MAG: TldD/PmbA family protein [Euryarchaeota archaeon]|nr:TldD/PmbA family protein [Euryarchaeota archaeon]